MKKLTTEEWIKKAKKVHGNRFDYSLVDYKNSNTKVKIICLEHGIFETNPSNHLYGFNCPKCGNNTSNTISFIKKAKAVHGDKYDYSLVEYTHSKTKIKIICAIHGIFEQTPNNHISKQQGCPSCNGGKLYDLQKFIKKSNLIHNDKFDYSLVNYINAQTKIKIICPIHGEFFQVPSEHMLGKGCNICRESKGEREISLILKKDGIKFIRQYKFENCINKRQLPFDFYLPDYNMCIEFQGRQHFIPIAYFGGEKALIEQQLNDGLKEVFCKNNKIPLLNINYNENINEKLKKFLSNFNPINIMPFSFEKPSFKTAST